MRRLRKETSKITCKISFVDTSYWDDGNRTTFITRVFDTKQECFDYLAKVKNGLTVGGQQGPVTTVVEPMDVHITEEISRPILWQEVPCFREEVEKNILDNMKSVIEIGGNGEEIEELTQRLGWNRDKFYSHWKKAIKEVAAKL